MFLYAGQIRSMYGNDQSDVSYYCSWVKTRFDNYLKCPSSEPLKPASEPLKTWLSVGDENYAKEPEWQSLRFYIFERYQNLQLKPEKENSEFLSDDEWAEKVRKDCQDILEGNG